MKTKQSILKMTKATFFVIVATLLFSSCSNHKEEKEALMQQNQQLQNELQTTETTVNELLQTLNEIESNLALIKEKEGMIALDAEDKEIDSEGKKKILSDIQAINSLMEENRGKMAELKEKLNKSGLKITQLDKKVANLVTQLDSKEKVIQGMKEDLTKKDFAIAGLNESVGRLAGQVAVQTSVIKGQHNLIEEQDAAINTKYVKVGTYKELKDLGVIEKEGWAFFKGKMVDVSDDAPASQFTAIDQRETNSIPLPNAKKASLVSEHPKGSYEFEATENDQIASLEITNPDEFWKLSKYLVVEVK